MRVPLSWLREYCPTSLSAEDVADALTEHGVEAEAVVRPWADLSGVVVARVLEVRDHPNADKLCLATVEAGAGEREVVVGVRNMGPGDLVPYAPPGATLPGFEGVLERREIRGVPSDGMLCSPKELAISGDHSRILVLAEGEPGEDVKARHGLDDAVIVLEVKPNRPDTMSIVGVAREVAAVTGEELRLPDTTVKEGPEKATAAASVEVLDGAKCPRYLARVVRGVTVGAAPLSAQVRLSAAGMRPLSNVVDATNYVLLEMGHPLHPFDLAYLAGPGIVVRRAEEDERMVTLDGEEREMIADDLMIADTEKGVAVAGVMGGASAEVSETTTDVLLESAMFEPRGIFRTARRLKLRTEASVRFERGADPEAVAPAAARAAAMITAWSGGTVLAGEIDVGEVPSRRTVSLRPSRAGMLLGMDLTPLEVREALGRLRLPVAGEDQAELVVEVPGYRVDLQREADLIEEVGRITGYDRVPSTLPGIRQAGGLTRGQRARRRIRDVLAGGGLWEAVSTSWAAQGDLGIYQDGGRAAIRIANPVAADQGYLRSALLPGLLAAARRNFAHRRTSVRLFEVGTVFLPGDPEPVEEERVAVLLAGEVAEEWPSEIRPHDFLDGKGLLEHLLAAVGVEGWSLGDPPGSPFHPGRSATVLVGQEWVGAVGELHPRVSGSFDLTGRVGGFELRTAPLAEAGEPVAYADVSRFPPVHRDLAYLVGGQVPAGALRAALVEAAGDLLDRVLLFDVYEGDPLPGGKKSLAFSVDFRAPDRTLTDEEADERVRAITERLTADFGAELRSG